MASHVALWYTISGVTLSDSEDRFVVDRHSAVLSARPGRVLKVELSCDGRVVAPTPPFYEHLPLPDASASRRSSYDRLRHGPEHGNALVGACREFPLGYVFEALACGNVAVLRVLG